MKRLQIQKNKFVRSILYILLYFFVIFIVSGILELMVQRGYSLNNYENGGVWEVIDKYWAVFLKFTTWPIYIVIIQQVWFGKLRPRPRITSSKD